MLRSRSVLKRGSGSRFLFRPAPAPIISRLSTIKKKICIQILLTRKMHKYFFKSCLWSMLERTKRIVFRIFLFHLCWNQSQSRTFKLAPAKMYRLRLHNPGNFTIILNSVVDPDTKIWYQFYNYRHWITTKFSFLMWGTVDNLWENKKINFFFPKTLAAPQQTIFTRQNVMNRKWSNFKIVELSLIRRC